MFAPFASQPYLLAADVLWAGGAGGAEGKLIKIWVKPPALHHILAGILDPTHVAGFRTAMEAAVQPELKAMADEQLSRKRLPPTSKPGCGWLMEGGKDWNLIPPNKLLLADV